MIEEFNVDYKTDCGQINPALVIKKSKKTYIKRNWNKQTPVPT